MLATIEIAFRADEALKKLSREDYAHLRAEIPQLRLDEWKPDDEKPPYWYCTDALIDLATDGQLLARHGIEFTVKRFKGTYIAASHPGAAGVSQHIHIAIPAIGLLTMDEVQVMEDACTDRLQRELDDGWRIIAVCPPDAKRRPDYILGRSKESRK